MTPRAVRHLMSVLGTADSLRTFIYSEVHDTIRRLHPQMAKVHAPVPAFTRRETSMLLRNACPNGKRS